MSDEKTQIEEDAKDFEGHQLPGGEGMFEPQIEEDFEGHQLPGGEGMFEPQIEEQLPEV